MESRNEEAPARNPNLASAYPSIEFLEDRLLLSAYYWVGPSDPNDVKFWSIGSNWEDVNNNRYTNPPGTSDDVVFGSYSNNFASIVDGAFTGAVASITLSSDSLDLDQLLHLTRALRRVA